MAEKRAKGSRTVLQVALVFQAMVVAVMLVSCWLGMRYIEHALRRSVEDTTAQSVAQWLQYLEILSQDVDGGQRAPAGHLLPIPTLSQSRLELPRPLPNWPREELPGLGEQLRITWPGGFSRGLEGFAEVRAVATCQRCHSNFVPGEVVGTLSFAVNTQFLTKLLASRKLNLAGVVLAFGLFTSAGIWLVAGLASRYHRQVETAAEAAVRALQASEERYRTLVEHSLVGVYLIQGNRFLYCNPRMAEMWGYASPEEIVESMSVSSLVAPEDRELVAENLRKRFSSDVQTIRYTFRALKRDGTVFPVEVFGTRTDLPTGPAVLGMVVDNTASERARQLLENAYRAVVALLGEDSFAAAASSLANFLNVPVAFVAEKDEDTLVLLGRFGPMKGQTIPLEGTPCAQVIGEKRVVEVPEGFSKQYGGEAFTQLVPEAYYGFPLVDHSGSSLGVVAVVDSKPRVLDEVERKIFEIYAVRLSTELETLRLSRQRQALEARLAASQKLAALGVLAGGVAHDFNNILAGIAAGLESLARHLRSEHGPSVQQVLALVQRGSDVVKRILAFARPQPEELRTVSLKDLVNEAITLARPSLGPQVHIEVKVEEGLFIRGDPGNLQQVVINLLSNARDAMPQGGTVRIQGWRQQEEVVFEVTDEGEGIAKEILPRVLEPFFTTKPLGQGTGLGLSTAYRTVEAHRGHLTIESEVGKGTTVRVMLPAAEPPTPEEAPPPLEPAWHPAGALVMVVDDEPAILDGIRELLTLEGFTVAAFSSAEAAWQWAQTKQPHLAILDVLLPVMSGLELATKLKERNPSLAVVFSSGYAPESVPPALANDGKVAFLAKPYPASKLLRTIATLLQQS